jgi:rod shape-determining protein MreC
MSKRPQYIALGVVIVLTLILLKLPSRATSRIKLALGGLFVPVFGASASADRAAETGANALLTREEMLKLLDRLEREREEARLQTARATELARENDRLRAQLGLPRQLPWRLKLASVVARDPANWWRSIQIDAGLRDGVTTNCPVFTAEGLVGRVSETGWTHSRVVLLGDPDCRVSAMIEETRDTGVIAPSSSSPLDNIMVDLGFLSRNSALRPGQRVVTSGLGGIFPKGLYIGQIVDHRSVDFGLYNEARVRVAVKMNSIEEVWVKLP